MTTNNPCLNAALEYLDQGLSVIPVGTDKRPLIAWKQFQKRQASEDEVYQWFERWPDANIAIVTGSISGIIVVDGDGEIGARWICDNLPRTSLYVATGRENGCHCYYRLPQGLIIQSANGFRPKVDVKAEGGYVVAPPSLHQTGRRYSWVCRDGLDGWKDLFELNLNDFREQAILPKTGNLNLDLSAVTTRAGNESLPTEEGGRNQTLASMVGKLVGRVSLDEALILARGWGAQCRPPMGDKEIRTTVESIYKTHLRNHPLADPAAVISGGADEIFEPFIGSGKTATVPVEILQPGGLMQEIMDYIEISSAASIPLFNVGAAASLVGSLIGQRVMTESGLRTNLYVIALGYSGSGKNAPISALPQLIRNSNAAILESVTELSSAAAVLKALASKGHHRMLISLDEIGMLLRGLKNPMDPRAEIPRILTKLFSGTDRSERKVYADEKLNFSVPWHHLSIYGASTPEEFWGSLSESDGTNGFLARLLILENKDPAPMPKSDNNPDVPAKLTNSMNELWGIEPGRDPNAGDLEIADDIRPVPIRIRFSPQASALLDPIRLKYHNLKNDARGSGCHASIYARVHEHALKLSLIHHMSATGAAGAQKTIGADSAAWAVALAEFACSKTLEGIRDNIAGSEWHANEQKIVRAIKGRSTAERPGLSVRELAKAVCLPEYKFNELIKGMISKGMVFTRQYRPKRGPETNIFCVPAEEGSRETH